MKYKNNLIYKKVDTKYIQVYSIVTKSPYTISYKKKKT